MKAVPHVTGVIHISEERSFASLRMTPATLVILRVVFRPEGSSE